MCSCHRLSSIGFKTSSHFRSHTLRSFRVCFGGRLISTFLGLMSSHAPPEAGTSLPFSFCSHVHSSRTGNVRTAYGCGGSAAFPPIPFHFNTTPPPPSSPPPPT